MKEREEFLKAILQEPGGLKTKDFIGVPIYGAFGDGKIFYTFQEVVWEPSGSQQEGLPTSKVPKGFITDLTSVPRAFWTLLPRDGKYLTAAIVHDFNYWYQDGVTRKQADDVFREGMRDLNVGRLKRTLIYQGVRKGGGLAWSKNKKLRESGEKRLMKKFPTDPTITWKTWKNDPDVFL